MNSEELEQSLRAEFESSLKSVLADVRQEISQFQEKIEAEIEKHKSQLDEVFRDFSARIPAEKELDENFKETVVEHLRLARDEGARITATAIAEAEAMEKESAEQKEPSAGISEIRDAINDISSNDTQASILKALVQHAAHFTPRGAFFIIKSEHLVGWRVFGKEGYSDEKAVREVFFPVSLSTVLGESVRSLTMVESAYGDYTDDSIYLNKLDFGQPDRMYAIPLVVRGRTVAVLYADYGTEGGEVNVEALETLARVASLTVEVLASARNAKDSQPEQDASYQSYPASQEAEEEDGEEESLESKTEAQPANSEEKGSYQAPEYESAEYESVSDDPVSIAEETKETVSEFDSQSFESINDSYDAKADFEDAQPEAVESSEEPEVEYQAIDVEAQRQPEYSQYYEPAATDDDASSVRVDDYQFESDQSFEQPETQFEMTPQAVESAQSEAPQFETSQFDASQFEDAQYDSAENFSPPVTAQDDFGISKSQNGKAESYVAEPVETVVSEPAQSTAGSQPVRARFSDRNVDLPIEVGEEERRLHNDARRFARLLVSEIKLYNEQKVKEGREAGDLYERLREAIDRSREMYDKRVQPPVAARFDYFHYELVNTLAEGDENNLGGSYPGAAV